MRAPLEPTAARAVLPAKRPTTTTSAALNSSCKMLDAASGSENRMIFCSIGPLVRSPEREICAMENPPPLNKLFLAFLTLCIVKIIPKSVLPGGRTQLHIIAPGA
jgi:hypothetical protein